MPEAQPQTKALWSRRRLPLVFACVIAVTAITATVASHYSSAGDQPMSKAELQSRLAAFEHAGQVALTPVASADHSTAVASMNLADQPAEARQAIEDGSEPLTWLTLWDDQTEDGDTVEIISHGYRRTIRLTSAPQRIAVPVPEGGVINVRGVYDGGGGITVAITTSQGQVALPVMAVGQVLGVPVKAGP